MLRFEAEPTREPYSNDVWRGLQRALAANKARAFDGRSPPCHCGFCTLKRQEGAWAPRMTVSPALAAEFEARRGEFLRPDGIVLVIHPDQIAAIDNQRDRIMAGVDMPGRIVDDVRPDQRGGQ